MTRIVALSDTHMLHDKIDVPLGDILIHAGDALNYGSDREWWDFYNWFREQPHKTKIFIPGNHERIIEKHLHSIKEECLANGIHLLTNDRIEIDGLNIHGVSYTPTFGSWSFMKDDTSDGLGKEFSNIGPGLDLLISHGPPKYILDTVSSNTGFEYAGSEELRKAVEFSKPRYMLVGHIHQNMYGGPDKTGEDFLGNTTVINVSMVDDRLTLQKSPLVLDL